MSRYHYWCIDCPFDTDVKSEAKLHMIENNHVVTEEAEDAD